ncbi:MAG: FIMAH domain-containing protein [Candidatus Nitrosopumilus sp. bin_6a]
MMLSFIIDEINKLEDDGTLNKGNVNSLNSKLENALKNIDAQKTKPASKQINAFVNEVNTFVKTGNLSQEQGQLLIEIAQDAIDSL